MGKAKKTKKKTIKGQVSTSDPDESVRRNSSEKEDDCTSSTVDQSWVRVLSKYSSTSTEYFRSTRVRVRVL